MNTKNTLKGCLLAILGYTFFVSHDLIVKILSVHYSVLEINFFALLFCFPFLTIISLNSRLEKGIWPHHPWFSLLRMILLLAASLLTFQSLAVAHFVDVYTLLLTQPLLVSILAVVILKEKANPRRMLAVLLGMAGTIVILQPGYQSISIFHVLALTAATLYACSSLILDKISQRESLVIIFLYPVMASLLFSGFAMIGTYIPPTLPHLMLMMLQGTLLVVAGFTINTAYRLSFASVVVPFQYTQIVWSVIFGVLLFGEYPNNATMVGGAMIAASGLFIIWNESLGKSKTGNVNLKARYEVASHEMVTEVTEIKQEIPDTTLLIDPQKTTAELEEQDYDPHAPNPGQV